MDEEDKQRFNLHILKQIVDVPEKVLTRILINTVMQHYAMIDAKTIYVVSDSDLEVGAMRIRTGSPAER